jgi:hypothetical protein
MTWREQILTRILLIVAKMLTDDPEIAQDVKNLATSIQVDAPREREKAMRAAGLE